MKLYCDRDIKTSPPTCRKHLVVIEGGKTKIFYIRLYYDKLSPTFKDLTAKDNLINAIIKWYGDEIRSEQNLKDIVQNVKNTYKTLKNDGNEAKTLDALSAYYIDECKIRLNFDNGILMHDKSLIFFYDFSDNMRGRLKSICKGIIL